LCGRTFSITRRYVGGSIPNPPSIRILKRVDPPTHMGGRSPADPLPLWAGSDPPLSFLGRVEKWSSDARPVNDSPKKPCNSAYIPLLRRGSMVDLPPFTFQIVQTPPARGWGGSPYPSLKNREGAKLNPARPVHSPSGRVCSGSPLRPPAMVQPGGTKKRFPALRVRPQ